jgi:NAD(P)-dependent dehydrogenase (short-subunit alcohol dehydrogenase family)
MNPNLKPLSAQVIVVFGASSGIGRVTALEASRRGARVIAAARGVEALRSLAHEAGAPDRFATMVADAADPEQVRAVADGAVAQFGRLDTWAHVAGVAEHARFEDMPLEDFRRVIEVDLLGPVHAAKAALPQLRRDGGGAFVVVSSMIAKRSFPLLSSYSAAKHGVNGFLESLRVELQHDGVPVAVTEIQPAVIDTPFFEHARTRLGVRPSAPPPGYPPEKVAGAIQRAAAHPKREVVVGGAGKAQLLTQRLSPRIMDAFSRVAMFRLQRSRDPKSPDDTDGLYRPVEGDDRRRGPVSNLRR